MLHFTGALYDKVLSSSALLSAEVPIALEQGGLCAVLEVLRHNLGQQVGIAVESCSDIDPVSGVADEPAPLLGLVGQGRGFGRSPGTRLSVCSWSIHLSEAQRSPLHRSAR